jgi:hypothetical protein
MSDAYPRVSVTGLQTVQVHTYIHTDCVICLSNKNETLTFPQFFRHPFTAHPCALSSQLPIVTFLRRHIFAASGIFFIAIRGQNKKSFVETIQVFFSFFGDQ